MKTPEWYWVHGLHDAKIISVIKKESDWNPADNCLIFKIDCDGAIGESDVTEIRFYNYKILTIDFDLNGLNGGWWLSDDLTQKGERYFLDLRFDTEKCKTKRLEIKFEKVEVIRNNYI